MSKIKSKLESAILLANHGGYAIVAGRLGKSETRLNSLLRQLKTPAVTANSLQALVHRLQAEYFDLQETADLAAIPGTEVGDEVSNLAQSAADDVLRVVEFDV